MWNALISMGEIVNLQVLSEASNYSHRGAYFRKTRSLSCFLFEYEEKRDVLFKCKGNFLMRKLVEQHVVDRQPHRNFMKRGK